MLQLKLVGRIPHPWVHFEFILTGLPEVSLSLLSHLCFLKCRAMPNIYVKHFLAPCHHGNRGIWRIIPVFYWVFSLYSFLGNLSCRDVFVQCIMLQGLGNQSHKHNKKANTIIRLPERIYEYQYILLKLSSNSSKERPYFPERVNFTRSRLL